MIKAEEHNIAVNNFSSMSLTIICNFDRLYLVGVSSLLDTLQSTDQSELKKHRRLSVI